MLTTLIFPLQDRESESVQNTLGSIDRRYQELLELAKLRKQRLLDALSLYKLFNEADSVVTWIDEKVSDNLIFDAQIGLIFIFDTDI